ncbi:MAG: tRNA-dihydrouridine synthase family protein [Candidatus Aenigmatarchaeota archaeon]
MPDFPKLRGRAILAPMAGYTDIAFRVLCDRYGASLTFTEFVSSAAVVVGHLNENILSRKGLKLAGVQIFGSDVDEIVEASKILEKTFDIIDLNCGCPEKEVTKIGAGSDLLKHPDKLFSIVKDMVDNVNVPITVKIRSGYGKKINALEIAKLVEKAGAVALTLHARTKEQNYGTVANWQLIKQVKESISIPVIGNGDIFSAEDFAQKLKSSQVDYVSIGRGALGNPAVFDDIKQFLEAGKYISESRPKMFMEYLKLAKKYKVSYNHIKSHAMYFTKGLENAAKIRLKIGKCEDSESITAIFRDFL